MCDAAAWPGRPTRRPEVRPTDDVPITRRMLGVDLDGSRRIEPAHVACAVGPDGSNGSRPIVWMINRMIKAHPTKNRMPRQAAWG
jgi:hypothetical protein